MENKNTSAENAAEQIKNDYRKLGKETGNDPTRDEFVKKTHWSRHQINRLFGSWGEFREAIASEVRGETEETGECAGGNPGPVFDPFDEYDDGTESGNIRVCREKYILDESEGVYYFLVPGAEPIEVGKDTVETMVAQYSDAGERGMTVRELAEYYNTDPQTVSFMLKSLNVTHADICPEDFIDGNLEDDPESAAEKIKARHEQARKVKREFFRKVRDDIREKARKWDKLQQKQLDPFGALLETYRPPADIKPADVRTGCFSGERTTDEVFCISLSDVHVGDGTAENTVFEDPSGFTQEQIRARLELYIDKIRDRIEKGKIRARDCVVFALGDLVDSLSGETDKGTQLDPQVLGEDQWKMALDWIYLFFLRLSEMFENVTIHSVKGNHDSVTDDCLVYTIHKILCECGILREEDLHLYKTRWGSTFVKNTYILFEHGYSPKYRNKVPGSNTGREGYVTGKMMQDATAKTGTDQHRVFLCADQHHREEKEFRNFDFIMNSTIVNTNKYASENAYGGRPSQIGFTITDDGVDDVQRFYLDDDPVSRKKT